MEKSYLHAKLLQDFWWASAGVPQCWSIAHALWLSEKFMQDLKDSMCQSIKKGEFKQDRSVYLISY